MPTDQEIENEIREKGLTAPRVTAEGINAKIDTETYIRTPADGLTVCKITLKNGFSFIGHSACASPENYDKELGDKIARDNAYRQIWSHEGYLLKEVLHQLKTKLDRGLGGVNVDAGVDPTDTQAALG